MESGGGVKGGNKEGESENTQLLPQETGSQQPQKGSLLLLLFYFEIGSLSVALAVLALSM